MISYDSEDVFSYFGREEFFVLIFYATTVDAELAKKLYYAGESEYIYRIYNGLSTDGMDYYDNNIPHWNVDDLTDVKNFINGPLLTSLNNEVETSMLEILGGWNYIVNHIRDGETYKDRFGIISEIDQIEWQMYYYVYMAESLRDVISNALLINKPYTITYDGN